MNSLTSSQNNPQRIPLSVTFIQAFMDVSLCDASEAGLHHTTQPLRFRFGAAVVKELEVGPCDGAWHVKNASAQAHAQHGEEILLPATEEE